MKRPAGAAAGADPRSASTTTATGLYRSDDGGATWRKVNNVNPRPMYFSQVRIDPNDPDVVYMGGVGLHQSIDGGKTVEHRRRRSRSTTTCTPSGSIRTNSNHVIIGNDGGLAQSWDQAKTWVFIPNLPVGLFYHVSVDMATPYNICGGMQDNYDWCGPSQVRGAAGIANHHWATIQGGDGFVVLQDPKDNRVIYSESQDGNIVRVDRVTGETMSDPAAGGRRGSRPTAGTGTRRSSLSPHDPAVVYVARATACSARRIAASRSTPISPDLTTGEDSDRERDRHDGPQGQRHHDREERRHRARSAPIVALAESPKTAGVLYAGTDDGRLQVTKDGGKTWTDVYQKLPNAPKGAFVSRVAPSRFDAGTVYATIDDHRQNDYETYIYASKDFGQTWTSLNGNLKGEVIKTITEDPKNPDVLYAGAETGLFVSTDRGAHLDAAEVEPADGPRRRDRHPSARQRDGAGDARPRDLGARSRRADPGVRRGAATPTAKLFTPPPASMFRRPARDRNYEFWGNQVFYGENPPQAAVISYFMKNKPASVEAEDHRRRRTRSARDHRCPRRRSEGGHRRRRAGICACSRCAAPDLGRGGAPRER